MELMFSTPLDGNLVLCNSMFEGGEYTRYSELYKFIWLRSGSLRLEIDHIPTEVEEGEIVCLTPLHRIDRAEAHGEYVALAFNSNFYCIFSHTNEVSCNGLLFNGSSDIMRLRPDAEKSAELEKVLGDIQHDYQIDDSLREEMLRMHLKHFIILATRIARDRFTLTSGKEKAFDIVRQFHQLVDRNFREKKQVQDYAEMLHRSPKTLSNLFSSCGCPSPLSVIRERVNAEARRLLLYTDKTSKEIAFLLGFDDTAIFSRFFSQMNGMSATEYRNREHNR